MADYEQEFDDINQIQPSNLKGKKDEISSNELKIINSLTANAINENLLKTRQNLLETFSMSKIKFAKFDTVKDEQNNLEIRKNGLVFAL